jgi:hypothetical protein
MMGINQEGVVGDSAMVSVPSATTAKYAGSLTEDSKTARQFHTQQKCRRYVNSGSTFSVGLD